MRTTVFLLCFVCMTGCSKVVIPELKSSSDFLINYSSGSGWTGWHYEMKIDSTGLINVHEEKQLPSNSERNETYKLTDSDLEILKVELGGLAQTELRNDYGFGPDKPTDLPVSMLIYRIGARTDSTSIYCPESNELPEKLNIMLERISSIRKKYDGLQ